MLLQSLYLHNFRNYEKLELSFGSSLNLISGLNAQGKTNLLEAIYFLSTGISFRTPHLSDLIRQGATHFYIEAHFIRENIVQELKLSYDGKTRKMHYNNTASSHFINLLGLLPTVLYLPNDVSLIMAAPALRRRFLNLHLAQSDPLYVHHLTRYAKAMKQRNHLLRHQSDAALPAWEQAMALSGSYLTQKRKELMEALRVPLQEAMKQLSQGEDLLEVNYQTSIPEDKIGDPTYLCAQLHKQRSREMHLGFTLTGPHRDELLFTINKKEAKTFSSEGQKRCAIAALRLAEWQLLATQVRCRPLFSIDDFGVHLDNKRQTYLHQQLDHLGQVFLTSPYAHEELLPGRAKSHFQIHQGKMLSCD